MLVRAALLVALACFVAALPGCGGETTQQTGTFRVALLTPGSISDGGWNQAAYDGLERVERELGARVSHVETKSPAQFEEEFRSYARDGFDLVFGHGFEYQEAAARVAPSYPETVFVTTSGNTVLPNLAPMVFELEQATYLCGWLAAKLSSSGRLGAIGGVDLPSIRSTFVAFRAGAEAARPGVSVREVFLGRFDDVPAAREAATALLDEGADFLIHQVNDAGRGVFQAVQERAAKGSRVYAFGTNRNQNDMAPDVVLASAVLDVPSAFVEVARRVESGSFRAEPIRLGMGEGIVSFVLNAGLSGGIEAPVLQELAALAAKIRSGELQVPRGNF
jgi:basic membrane lipoprotein Med (substrate-binding protein (PBP1-ABC) superfamily)